MSREIKRKINRIKTNRRAALEKRVSNILNRYGFQLKSEDEIEQYDRDWEHMIANVTPSEREDLWEYLLPDIMEKLKAAKNLIIYPIIAGLVEDHILPVIVELQKDLDPMASWKFQTLWMWGKDPITYREWHTQLFRDENERMPEHLITWYKKMSAGFHAVIEQVRQDKIQHLQEDLEFFRNEPGCEEDAAALEKELKELQIIV